MPRPLTDMTGRTLGRLTVLRRHGTSSRPVYWECRCECGATKVVAYKHLRSGSTVSCGCYRNEMNARPKVHGHSKAAGRGRSPTYITWEGMKQRCHNPAANGYTEYGARGITVCDSWRESFERFLADMGERPDGMTLDRIDNDRGYEPDNCRWATRSDQQSNRKCRRMVEHNGRSVTVTQLAREHGLSRGVLWHRLFGSQWDLARALSTPVAGASGIFTITNS